MFAYFQPFPGKEHTAGFGLNIIFFAYMQEYWILFENNYICGVLNVESLFKQYYPRLRNYASRFIGTADVAEDIVQECFVKLYEKRFTLKDVSPGALLFVMVRNSCINYRKRQMLPAISTTPISIINNITPEDDLMFEELRVEIDRVMRKLPPRCKEVFYMSRFEGLNTREIAERTGTSTQNVEKHISRAMNIFSSHFSGLDIATVRLI